MGFFDFFKKKQEPQFEKIDFDKFNFDSTFDKKTDLGLNINKPEPPPSFNEPSYNTQSSMPVPNQYNPSLNLSQQPTSQQVVQQNPMNVEDIKLIKDSLENIKNSLEALNQRTLKIEKEVTRRW